MRRHRRSRPHAAATASRATAAPTSSLRDDHRRERRLAHAARRRRARRQQRAGERQELVRHAVADRRARETSCASTPASSSTASQLDTPASAVRCDEVAEDRQRLPARPPHGHPQLHRRQVLRLVDDHVAEAPEAGIDQPMRLVEQRHVRRRHVAPLHRRRRRRAAARSRPRRAGRPPTRSSRARFLNSFSTRPSGVSRGHARLASFWYSRVLRTALIASSSLTSERGVERPGREQPGEPFAEALAAGLVAERALAHGGDAAPRSSAALTGSPASSFSRSHSSRCSTTAIRALPFSVASSRRLVDLAVRLRDQRRRSAAARRRPRPAPAAPARCSG